MLSVTTRVDNTLLLALLARLPVRAETIVREAGRRLYDDAARRAPVGHHEGEQPGHVTLREGLSLKVTGRYEAILGERAPHGPFVEYPTAAHPIYPVHGHYLHFIAGGADVFARAVNHPGTHAQPFMAPAADAWPHFVADVAALFTPGGRL